MTTVYPQAWERTLLPLAYEAEHRGVAPTPIPVSDPALLDAVVTYQVLMTVSIPHHTLRSRYLPSFVSFCTR